MDASRQLRVLVVDDEKAIRKLIEMTLVPHGYKVFEASDAAEALEMAVSTRPDAVILDLGLPDRDGIEVIAEIRKRARTPIIVLSIRQDRSDKITALDTGADDYLTKPFDVGEMIARLKSVMRRLTPAGEKNILQAGNLSIDIARRGVELSGKPVRLTPTEYEVLKVLVTHSDKVLTRQQILREVWGKSDDSSKSSHLLTVTINNLRDKIEARPDLPVCILTEPSVGYRFNTGR